MKIFLLMACLAVMQSAACTAQITAVLIGVNGLTCSQCTRNVEMQLRRLPFVAAVEMNLQHTSGTIRLKDGAGFAPEQVTKAISDAGFSTRYLKIVVAYPAQYQTAAGCFTLSKAGYQLVGNAPDVLPESLCLQLLGVPYQPRKDARPLPAKACADSRYFVTPSREDQ